MTRLAGALLLLSLAPTCAGATTARDLSSRIRIDGRTDDITGDEWVVDGNTLVAEVPGDSPWGTANDVRRLAVTWDDAYLYVAVEAVVRSTSLLLYVDSHCGDAVSSAEGDASERNIEFGQTGPNLIVVAERGSRRVRYGDCDQAALRLDPDDFRAVLFQDGAVSGAFEIAIPWERLGPYEISQSRRRVPVPGTVIRVLAAVTGGAATSAGDALPDPTRKLDGDSTRVAVLDNAVLLPLDHDLDGILDTGVSPRASATYAVTSVAQSGSPLQLRVELEQKLFSPDRGEVLRFRADLQDRVPVYLTARVYSLAGRVVRRLYDAERRDPTIPGEWDEWDGRGDDGQVVPGGIYVLAVLGGIAPGAESSAVRRSFAVVR